MVAEQFALYVAELLERPLNEDIALQARLTIEMGYGAVEMALEDRSSPPEATLREGARMLEIYWRHILESKAVGQPD